MDLVEYSRAFVVQLRVVGSRISSVPNIDSSTHGRSSVIVSWDSRGQTEVVQYRSMPGG